MTDDRANSAKSENDHTRRACLNCPSLYTGPLDCPRCGEPGEPLIDLIANGQQPTKVLNL
jgi:hypothetical protein